MGVWVFGCLFVLWSFSLFRLGVTYSECGTLTRTTSTQLQHEKLISLLCTVELEVGEGDNIQDGEVRFHTV
jgi:hypothetical protein